MNVRKLRNEIVRIIYAATPVAIVCFFLLVIQFAISFGPGPASQIIWDSTAMAEEVVPAGTNLTDRQVMSNSLSSTIQPTNNWPVWRIVKLRNARPQNCR